MARWMPAARARRWRSRAGIESARRAKGRVDDMMVEVLPRKKAPKRLFPSSAEDQRQMAGANLARRVPGASVVIPAWVEARLLVEAQPQSTEPVVPAVRAAA